MSQHSASVSEDTTEETNVTPTSYSENSSELYRLESKEKLVMNGYSPFGTLSTTAQPEIVNAIQQLPLENEVVSKAIEVFYEIGIRENHGYAPRTKSVKGSRKIKCIFYCIFMAYNQLECPVDPSYAADLIGLPRNEIEQAFNEYSPSGAMLIKPEQLLRFYIQRINNLVSKYGIQYNLEALEKESKRIIDVCRSTTAGKEWVENTAAKIVAIVSLYFYLNDIRGLEIGQNIQIFEHACYLSWACIRRYHEQITRYYNADYREHIKQLRFVLPFC
jgi:hypothetical protein